ncbi:MAG: SDR family oxidoreductase [Solirubrobacterales bacterium]|nr:SDR family oxidoreductase [Solirubrobacterales bacterium]
MELQGKVVVVTGAASGIDKAMACRFSEEGAAGVVLADLDGDRAQDLAECLPGPALGVRCDVRDPAQVDALVTGSESCFGPVDLFCANAGVGAGTDPMSPDEDWDVSFDVNVRSHVYAARRLLPGWLERGSGWFLSTASAAGLLTQVGGAPYAVSKHAAVAFAEWLAVTYGDRGIGVSCLCPMGVDTPMLRQGEQEGGMAASASATVKAAGDVLQPEQVAGAVVQALRDERFLILPHPEVLTFFQRKAGDYERWLAGMRRLQAQVAGAS